MNRKKFIATISILGVGSIASFYGYKIAKTKGNPDIEYLENNKELIAELSEVIIPKTNTPGAKESNVFEYIIYAIKKSNDKAYKNNFINGLKEVQLYSENTYGKLFINLDKKQKQEVVLHFKENGKNFSGNLGKVKNKILGKSFFSILKETTSIGYCTSKLGAKEGLAYQYVPTHFIGCTNYTKGQKSWATK
jgi:hypothetical protein